MIQISCSMYIKYYYYRKFKAIWQYRLIAIYIAQRDDKRMLLEKLVPSALYRPHLKPDTGGNMLVEDKEINHS